MVLPYWFQLFSVPDFGFIKVTKDDNRCLDYQNSLILNMSLKISLIKKSIHIHRYMLFGKHACFPNTNNNKRRSLKYKYKNDHSMQCTTKVNSFSLKKITSAFSSSVGDLSGCTVTKNCVCLGSFFDDLGLKQSCIWQHCSKDCTGFSLYKCSSL